MGKRFEGKRAVVTGAAGDVGRLVVEALIAEGADVLGVDRDAVRGAELTQKLAEEKFEFVELDLTDPEAIGRVFGAETAVDVLVNAAGAILLRPVVATTVEEWDLQFAINVRSAFLIAQALGEKFTENSAIVSISSLGGIKAEAGFGAYSASKAALIQLTKVLARELAPRTRVNVVAPGGLDTQMPRKMLEGHPQAEEIMASVGSANPLQRIGRPEEIVPMILLLASGEASFISGATVVIDAGMSA